MKRYRVRSCHKTASPDLDWSTAELLTDFCFPWEETVPPRTEFRALWDDEHLHFHFDCVDEDVVLGAGDTAHERVLGSDRAEIFLTSDLRLNPYCGFEMAPNGEVLAYQARHYRQFDRTWACDGFEFSAQSEERRYII
jgi:hypothetical protein